MGRDGMEREGARLVELVCRQNQRLLAKKTRFRKFPGKLLEIVRCFLGEKLGKDEEKVKN